MNLLATILGAGEKATHSLRRGRSAWLQVARGSVDVNGETFDAGDGAALRDEAAVAVTGQGDRAEILLFDLP